MIFPICCINYSSARHATQSKCTVSLRMNALSEFMKIVIMLKLDCFKRKLRLARNFFRRQWCSYIKFSRISSSNSLAFVCNAIYHKIDCQVAGALFATPFKNYKLVRMNRCSKLAVQSQIDWAHWKCSVHFWEWETLMDWICPACVVSVCQVGKSKVWMDGSILLVGKMLIHRRRTDTNILLYWRWNTVLIVERCNQFV